ncbi:MAG: DegV family protein [Clostridiales bacterium]|nr:DegV family protein [Clostridiales bacterium]
MRIITDSAADFSQEELAQYQIRCVSTQVIFGGEVCTPGLDLSHEDFWLRLLAGGSAKTSQPAPGAFLDAFQAAKDAGEEVVCVCVSSGVSGTVQSARLAAAMCDWEGLHVVDSLTGTAAQKLLVLHACRLRDEGRLTAGQVAAELESMRGRVRLLASLDTLEYLARSGRIPRALAGLGALTKLKPLLEVSREGKIVLAGKAFGRHRAIDSLAQRVAETAIDPACPVIPLYSYDPSNCHALVRKLKSRAVEVSGDFSAIGPSIAPHIGPNAYGVAFVAAP